MYQYTSVYTSVLVACARVKADCAVAAGRDELRLYSGSIQALFRLCSGSTKPLACARVEADCAVTTGRDEHAQPPALQPHAFAYRLLVLRVIRCLHIHRQTKKNSEEKKRLTK
jgi:hypothetical protein